MKAVSDDEVSVAYLVVFLLIYLGSLFSSIRSISTSAMSIQECPQHFQHITFRRSVGVLEFIGFVPDIAKCYMIVCSITLLVVDYLMCAT